MPARKTRYCGFCGIRVYAQESTRKRRGLIPICEPCQKKDNILM